MVLCLGTARTQAGMFLVNARVYQARWRASRVRADGLMHARLVLVLLSLEHL